MKTIPFSAFGRTLFASAVILGSQSVLLATPEMGPSGPGEIKEFILMEVNSDSHMTGAKINVTFRDGIAILTGTSPTLNQSERAAARALATDGVRGVVNQIRVNPAASAEGVREKALAALKAEPALDASRIDVAVADGSLELKGQVGTWDEQELARDVVSAVKGVSIIENRLEVTFDTVRTDAQIQAQIAHMIADDPLYEGLHLRATVKEGIVTLGGEVGNRGEYDRLVRRAYVTGVFAVKATKLTLNSDLAMEAMGDKDFTPAETLSTLKQALAADNRVEAKNIQLTFNEGVVVLDGVVKSGGERAAAESTSRGVPGVRTVSNQLRVVNPTEVASNQVEIR